jgi:hypothetical protein
MIVKYEAIDGYVSYENAENVVIHSKSLGSGGLTYPGANWFTRKGTITVFVNGVEVGKHEVMPAYGPDITPDAYRFGDNYPGYVGRQERLDDFIAEVKKGTPKHRAPKRAPKRARVATA